MFNEMQPLNVSGQLRSAFLLGKGIRGWQGLICIVGYNGVVLPEGHSVFCASSTKKGTKNYYFSAFKCPPKSGRLAQIWHIRPRKITRKLAWNL